MPFLTRLGRLAKHLAKKKGVGHIFEPHQWCINTTKTVNKFKFLYIIFYSFLLRRIAKIYAKPVSQKKTVNEGENHKRKQIGFSGLLAKMAY